MSKNIIFCADGTWNGPGQSDSDDKNAPVTNVFKLFLHLAGDLTPDSLQLAKEQEKAEAGVQVAKYLHGVGDSDNVLVKMLGGSLGAGLISRIVRGYTFISRNYCQDDKIFIVGFSRGAYTARALAGLICSKGLLDATKLNLDNKDQAYRWGSAVWYGYMSEVLKKNQSLLGKFEDFMLDLPRFFQQGPPAETIQVQIEAVGVWDTVGAMGIPEFSLKGERVDAFAFADRTLSPKVSRGLHAVAVDEQRADFTPTLWNPDQRISQVLFPGAHADVGGGYPTSDNESGLSDRALMWMADEMARLGVNFSSRPQPPTTPPPPLSAGPAHEPWAKPPWIGLVRRSRQFPPPTDLALSQSVLDRLAAGVVVPDPDNPVKVVYAPPNLGAYVARGKQLPGVTVVKNC